MERLQPKTGDESRAKAGKIEITHEMLRAGAAALDPTTVCRLYDSDIGPTEVAEGIARTVKIGTPNLSAIATKISSTSAITQLPMLRRLISVFTASHCK